ncbi:MAG: DUF4276 family protein [Anaerolineales bacterium]|nr:DUF4276 family protein [Anaerolineales bacterium]
MSQLVIAFYGEGASDEKFLPPLIQRTVEQIILQHKGYAEVLPPAILDGQKIRSQHSDQMQRIIRASQEAHGFHLLVIHADADSANTQKAYDERIKPGIEAVNALAHSQEPVCSSLLPIIPVRMVEAWMLADLHAFQQVVGTNLTYADLKLPQHPQQVELLQEPKTILQQAVTLALSRRSGRRLIPLDTIYEPLARQISLERLARIPAYVEFQQGIVRALQRLHIISQTQMKGAR